jgi:hypothetical protein
MPVITRRRMIATTAGVFVASARPIHAARPVYFGLTPVFLDSDIKLLATLAEYLTDGLEQAVSLVKRRTYQEHRHADLRWLSAVRDDAERRHILAGLERTSGHIKKAVDLLGLSTDDHDQSVRKS